MINKKFLVLYFCSIFSCAHIFLFSAMALHRCMTNNAEQFYLTIEATMRGKRPFKMYYRGKCPQKEAAEEPLPSENCLQEIKLPFRKLKLYLRPNMTGWNISDLTIWKNSLLLDAAHEGVRGTFWAQSSI